MTESHIIPQTEYEYLHVELKRLKTDLEHTRQIVGAARQEGFDAALNAIGRWVSDQPRHADWGSNVRLLGRALQAVREEARLDAADVPAAEGNAS